MVRFHIQFLGYFACLFMYVRTLNLPGKFCWLCAFGFKGMVEGFIVENQVETHMQGHA